MGIVPSAFAIQVHMGWFFQILLHDWWLFLSAHVGSVFQNNYYPEKSQRVRETREGIRDTVN